MNTTFNFNPDDKRMQLAALLQDPTQPYQRAKNPMGAPSSGMGGLNDMMMKMLMQKNAGTQPGAPVADRSAPYNPNSQNFTPSTSNY